MRLRILLILAAALSYGSNRGACGQDPAPQPPVVIPFDFQSTFDDGRYGRMIGDMVWKKLNNRGRFVIPEAMLDVRDWSERTRTTLGPDTALADIQRIIRNDFGAQVAIWGRVERVAGQEFDIYDLWIRIADFSGPQPRMIHQVKARTKTVSEIPHVYIKAALDQLYGASPASPAETALAAADAASKERLWQTAPNLVQGSFERPGPDGPIGWDALPRYVSRVTVAASGSARNHVIRFQFPKSVAASSGVLYYSDWFPVEEGATYRFQCRWRTTGSAAKVFIKCYDELPTSFRGGRAAGASRSPQPGTKQQQVTGKPTAFTGKPQPTAGEQSTTAPQRREVYRSQQNLKGPPRTWNAHREDFTPRHTQYTPRWGRVMLYAYWPAGAVDWDDIIVKRIAPPPANLPPKTSRPSLETEVLTEELQRSRPADR